MLELFPEGFEEVDRPQGVELAAYTDAGGEERLWHFFGGARADDVEAGWEDRWRAFHQPVRVGALWIGPPWETPPGDALAVVVDPGRAFGTGSHATTQLCLQFLQELERGSLLDVGCGSGVLSIAAALLGFAPVVGVDIEEPVDRGDARERARERRRGRGAARRPPTTGCRRRRPRSRTSRSPRSRRSRAASTCRGSSPRATSPRSSRACRASTHVERRTHGGWASRPLRARVSAYDSRRGDVPRRLPRLQGLARRRARGARGAPARRPRRKHGHDDADVAVISTCCVTNEAVAKSRKAAARAARTHSRVYLTGCGANLGGGAFAGLPRERHRRREAQRGDGVVRRRRRRRDRLRPGRRADRPRARVREDPGRLLVLVQLLRDPARARRVAQPQRRRGAGGDPPPRRAGPSRGRADRDQPRLLPRPRRRATTCRASCARRGRRPASSGCGSARSRSTT